MSQFNEVVEPIICDAYAEPSHHWVIEKGQLPVKAPGRREACYYYRPPGRSTGAVQADEIRTRIPLDGVNDIRKRVEAWQFLRERVEPAGHTDPRDVFLDPYYSWAVETLSDAVVADDTQSPEVPRYEAHRGPRRGLLDLQGGEGERASAVT